MRRFMKGLWFIGFTALLLEAGIRATGLDMRVLRPLLFYQQAIPELHEPSSDLELLYRLRPGAQTVLVGASFHVNDLGFRDPPRLPRKAPGVVRIFCLGASYMFGARVDDEESLPRQLETLLNRDFQGRFEVWNAGVSAYNVRQEAAYARTIERKYEPDLLLFHLNGTGRRAFLPGQPHARLFRDDPRLYLENLAWTPLGSGPWARRLLAASALYRTAVIWRNRRHPVQEPRPEYTDALGQQAWRDYLAGSAPALPKAALVLGRGPLPGGVLPLISLYRGPHVPARLPPEYFLIHPPAPVYRLQAQVVARRLAEEFPGLIRWQARAPRLVPAMSAAAVPYRLNAREIAEAGRAMREAGRDDCLASLPSGPAPARPSAPTGSVPDPPHPARVVPQVDPVLDQAARFCDQGREGQALAVLAKSPTRQARHRTALVYQRLGRFPEAVSVLEGLLREDPANAVYLKDLGISEHLSGRTKDAVRDLERSLRLAPDLLAATQSLGTILQARGNRGEALRLYRRALQVPAMLGREPLRTQIQDSARRLERQASRP
ncbi:MAG: tetratricopeptide repeat protein [Elusimicrobia bacterium]|nr:tetratricopeptide repeat protein [Elusimicrobiota bacterium]